MGIYELNSDDKADEAVVAPPTIIQLTIGLNARFNTETEERYIQIVSELQEHILSKYSDDVCLIDSEFLDLLDETPSSDNRQLH